MDFQLRFRVDIQTGNYRVENIGGYVIKGECRAYVERHRGMKRSIWKQMENSISKTLSSLAGHIQHYTVPQPGPHCTVHSQLLPASPQLIHCLTQSVYSDLTVSL